MQHTASQAIWIDLDDIQLHCLTAGATGSVVVLLHGAGLDSATLSWGEVIGPLAAQHRVFAPDLPGYGDSSRPALAYTIDFYVTVLKHMLERLHLEKVSLVGLSMGGAIALGLTLALPTRVEKLILVDTYGIQDTVVAHRLSYLYVHVPFLDEFSFWLMGRSRSLIRWSLLANLINNPAHLSHELVEQVYQAAHEPRAGKAYISFQRNDMLWSGLRTNFTARLHEIRVPTLLLHGAHDQAVPLAWAKRAQAYIPGATLVVMPDCKHWPQRENPQEFLRLVGNFLDA